MARITNLPDLKYKPFGGAFCTHDVDLCASRDLIIRNFTEKNNYLADNAEEIKRTYLSTYKTWMFSSFRNIKGFEDFSEACFTNGTTHTFSHFYIRYKDKRFRIFKGEYFFHQMMKGLYFQNQFAWLDEDVLRPGDAVIISVPFSETGNVPDSLESILQQCDELEIPVLLDMAYLNLAVDLEIDLTHTCIKYISSSLSKVFPVDVHRIGIRLQRQKDEDQVYVINEYHYNYINILSAYLGLHLMSSYSSNYLFNKYRESQLKLCEKLNLTPSSCVYFGIDFNNQYPEYNRGGNSNRLSFSRIWDGRCSFDFT